MTIAQIRATALLVFLAASLLSEGALGLPVPFAWRLTGSEPRGLFGRSVSYAGDVNGDGYGDVIVGQHGDLADTGRAYVYYGGLGRDSIPDIVLSPEMVPSWPGFFAGLGEAVAALGDVDGDGFTDVAAGASRLDVTNVAGRVLILFGGPSGNRARHLILSGTSTLGKFGASVSSAGDFNGDGFADILVGAPGANSCGRAYIFFGGYLMDGVSDLTLAGSGCDSFGGSVAAAGDVNGDGYADVIVGAAAGVGHAYIFFGGPGADSIPDVVLGTGAAGEEFGYPVSSAGDMNGDGFADLIVGAQSTAGIDAGRAYVYFGGPQLDATPDLTLTGSAYQTFGISVSSAGDVNGDGFSDVLVGAPGDLAGVPGHAYIFLGGSRPDSIPDVTLSGGPALGGFGASVSAGDVTGDGVNDLIVGVPFAGDPIVGQEPGTVLVYDVASSLPARAFLRDGNRTIPLTDGPSQICVQYQPMDGDYKNADVDLSSLRLASSGTGAVSEIPAVVPKTTIERDTDQDGIPELSACFNRSDLARLFSSVRGRHVVEVALEGSLESGRKFRAPLSLTILGTGKPEAAAVSLAPNPLNPGGTLTFSMGSPGEVTVRLYDLGGRSVRTVVGAEQFPAGVHRISIEGRDDRGTALASGVYFYRLETREGASTGRFVVLK